MRSMSSRKSRREGRGLENSPARGAAPSAKAPVGAAAGSAGPTGCGGRAGGGSGRGGGGVWAGWVRVGAWRGFSGLIDLRERGRPAWANVHVQLKRRAVLVPNLVRAVEGLRDYERQVQSELAVLRSQLAVTALGEPGPDPRGCAPLLLAIVERYPALKAAEAFLGLQRELTATGERIALAREYSNGIATFYNTRLQVVPDRYLAGLGRLRPRPLIAATEFERAPVRVSLAG